MALITELTKAQEKMLEEYRDKYLQIGIDTTPVNFREAEEVIKKLYQWGKIDVPKKFVYLRSPMECEKYLNALSLDIDVSGIGTDPDNPGIHTPIKFTKAQKDKLSYIGTWFNGQQDAHWVSFYAFAKEIGAKYDAETDAGLEIWKEIVEKCHWFYPCVDVCVISDKPREIHFDDEGMLHNEHGYAFVYSDGWGGCAVHGVRIPKHIILNPKDFTAQDIMGEQNLEIARVMTDIYDRERYIGAFMVDAGAKEVSRDEVGILYRMDIPNDEPIVMVRVENSTPEPDGTFKIYFIPVPPNVKTAKEGIAWSFEQDADKYEPLVET